MAWKSLMVLAIGMFLGCSAGSNSPEAFRKNAVDFERSRLEAQKKADAKTTAIQRDDVNSGQVSKPE